MDHCIYLSLGVIGYEVGHWQCRLFVLSAFYKDVTHTHTLFVTDVWTPQLPLWLWTAASSRGYCGIWWHLCVQASGKSEIPLQWAHAGPEHVCSPNCPEDTGVPLTTPGAGESHPELHPTSCGKEYMNPLCYFRQTEELWIPRRIATAPKDRLSPK